MKKTVIVQDFSECIENEKTILVIVPIFFVKG